MFIIPTKLNGEDVLLFTSEGSVRGSGKEITKGEALAPLGHMVGRFGASVSADSHDDMCALAKEIGVDYYAEKDEHTSNFVFRGPSGPMQLFFEKCNNAAPALS